MGKEGRAACRETGVMMLFFGPDGERPPDREIRERKAKAVCARCPLRVQCLEYALGHPVRYGIWGGLNIEELAAERRRLLRRGALRAGPVSPGAVHAAGRR
ncbi:MAG TPA: WhiB family transcriptional regulator [Streptosporangiaceae bacterium]|nr:WhiB family transcriptional regulator [Streptosporangiaceae bacterium]